MNIYNEKGRPNTPESQIKRIFTFLHLDLVFSSVKNFVDLNRNTISNVEFIIDWIISTAGFKLKLTMLRSFIFNQNKNSSSITETIFHFETPYTWIDLSNYGNEFCRFLSTFLTLLKLNLWLADVAKLDSSYVNILCSAGFS